jgi:hypothetical protein
MVRLVSTTDHHGCGMTYGSNALSQLTNSA